MATYEGFALVKLLMKFRRQPVERVTVGRPIWAHEPLPFPQQKAAEGVENVVTHRRRSWRRRRSNRATGHGSDLRAPIRESRRPHYFPRPFWQLLWTKWCKFTASVAWKASPLQNKIPQKKYRIIWVSILFANKVTTHFMNTWFISATQNVIFSVWYTEYERIHYMLIAQWKWVTWNVNSNTKYELW